MRPPSAPAREAASRWNMVQTRSCKNMLCGEGPIQGRPQQAGGHITAGPHGRISVFSRLIPSGRCLGIKMGTVSPKSHYLYFNVPHSPRFPLFYEIIFNRKRDRSWQADTLNIMG